MSQLLSGKQKGRFGAPPEATKQRSPWSYVPIIVLLPITIVLAVITAVPWTTYFNCRDTGDFDNPLCVGARLRPPIDGTLSSIVFFTGALLLLAFVLNILAAVKLKSWPVWLCWSFAVIGCAAAVVALLVLNGSMATPFGELGDIPPPSSTG